MPLDCSEWIDLLEEDLKLISDEDLELLILRLLNEAAARGDHFVFKVNEICEEADKAEKDNSH